MNHDMMHPESFAAAKRLAKYLQATKAVGLEYHKDKRNRVAFVVYGDTSRTFPLVVTPCTKEEGLTRAVKTLHARNAQLLYVAPAGNDPVDGYHAQFCKIAPDDTQTATLVVQRLTDLAPVARVQPSPTVGLEWYYVTDRKDDQDLLVHGGAELWNTLKKNNATQASSSETVGQLLVASSLHQISIWFCHGCSDEKHLFFDGLHLSGGRRLLERDLLATTAGFDGREILLLACGRPRKALSGSRVLSLARLFAERGAALSIGTLGAVDARLSATLGIEYLERRRQGCPPWDAWLSARNKTRAAAEEIAANTASASKEAGVREQWKLFEAYGPGILGGTSSPEPIVT